MRGDTSTLNEYLKENEALSNRLEGLGRELINLRERLHVARQTRVSLLGESNLADLEMGVDQLRGRCRAMEFLLTALTGQHAALLESKEAATVGRKSLCAELEALITCKSEVEAEIAVVLSKIDSASRSSDIVFPNESEFQYLQGEVARLDSQISVPVPELSNLDALKAQLADERERLHSRSAILVSGLRDLEARQTHVCESAMDRLAHAIEREERMLRLMAKRRELSQLGGLPPSNSLTAIPEDALCVAIDFEAVDIDARQDELKTLHQAVHEANQIRQALTDRLAQAVRSLG